MTEPTELKPCSACGGTPQKTKDPDWVTCSNASCWNWGHWMPFGAWNTRPIEDALRAEVERLQGENEKIKEQITDAKAAAFSAALRVMVSMEEDEERGI